jgi:hypothetical protein
LSSSIAAAGQFIDSLIDRIAVVYRGIPRESDFKAGLKCSPVLSREVGAVPYVLKAWSAFGVDRGRQVIRAECWTDSQMHRQNEVLNTYSMQIVGGNNVCVCVCVCVVGESGP